ncbi:Stress responsive A/B Barrel Domain protein [Maioricimonas rarisocia]|uniref:Stress responsive A/B Barrel Domain protein n=1 Tax=Maioricimonas rarisocia TaxID=2528026 RepID=A0A517Z744_9PLAN|nr:Dabb family protein [Maioricimonas rarisocia]QDU38300.1 Stress responsive A/B Barrel Domain protein [Maioricimonas rarisocia]
MKSWIITTLAFGILAGVLAVQNENQAAPESKKVLRHVVLFKFKEDATKEQIREVEEAFAELPSKIDAIHDYEWGTNNSPEGHDKGFTHCFLVTFRDEAGRSEYLPHPAHQAFVKVLRPILDDVTVVDYWASVD